MAEPLQLIRYQEPPVGQQRLGRRPSALFMAPEEALAMDRLELLQRCTIWRTGTMTSQGPMRSELRRR
jgi:hypothetical protein